MNNLARALSRNTAPSGRLAAAQKHEARRKAGDMATAIDAVQWATCDLCADDAMGVVMAMLDARPDFTAYHLQALERHVGRLIAQEAGHRLDDIARKAGL